MSLLARRAELVRDRAIEGQEEDLIGAQELGGRMAIYLEGPRNAPQSEQSRQCPFQVPVYLPCPVSNTEQRLYTSPAYKPGQVVARVDAAAPRRLNFRPCSLWCGAASRSTSMNRFDRWQQRTDKQRHTVSY